MAHKDCLILKPFAAGSRELPGPGSVEVELVTMWLRLANTGVPQGGVVERSTHSFIHSPPGAPSTCLPLLGAFITT